MKKIDLKYKIIIILVILLVLIYFLILRPFLDFKKLESKFLNAGKRYYEINNTQLPTGTRIQKLYLKKLYDKDYIDSEFKERIRNRGCSLDNSFIRVRKNSSEYIYETYLECGIFKSHIDHNGPVIKLNGQDEITVYRDEKYKELGVNSVNDDTDGNIDVKRVSIDNSKVNMSKTGTYLVTYKIKDSYNNVTEKKRIIHVIENLNHIVVKQTKNKNIYKGAHSNNYVQLDGMVFKIIGINSDKSVKVVSNDFVAALNYKDAEEWLNKYFYEKFSDSAKEYIKKDSKWCVDTVSDPNNYKKCSKYSKKNPVGLLSIIDYENSKDSNGITDLQGDILISNLKDKNKVYVKNMNNYEEKNINSNIKVVAVLNLNEGINVSSGSGTVDDPYRLEGNTRYLKPGEKISNAVVGSYILYSDYIWRVIGKEEDGTTKIIMDDIVKDDYKDYLTIFTNSSDINFNPSDKENIGYKLGNEVSRYVQTKLFVAKKENYPKYLKSIGYKALKKDNQYKMKINLPSMYDLFSTSFIEDYWYKDYSNDKYCYMVINSNIVCYKNQYTVNKKGIRAVSYLNKNVTIIKGKGTSTNFYILSNKI